MMEEEKNFPEGRRLPFLPFAIQLQNAFAAEVVAKHFPVDVSTFNFSDTRAEFSLDEINVNEERFQAQVILNVQLFHSGEPRLFEMAFKLVGIFTYNQEYNPEMVRRFIERESLSILLPFARELVLSLCTRLQLPPILLPIVQVALPYTNEATQDGMLH